MNCPSPTDFIGLPPSMPTSHTLCQEVPSEGLKMVNASRGNQTYAEHAPEQCSRPDPFGHGAKKNTQLWGGEPDLSVPDRPHRRSRSGGLPGGGYAQQGPNKSCLIIHDLVQPWQSAHGLGPRSLGGDSRLCSDGGPGASGHARGGDGVRVIWAHHRQTAPGCDPRLGLKLVSSGGRGRSMGGLEKLGRREEKVPEHQPVNNRL
jgi:hypothetical protein